MPLYLPKKNSAQPQKNARINWSNPLTRGIKFSWEASNESQNIVDSTIAAVSTTGENTVTSSGISRKWNGSQANASYTWGTSYFPIIGANRLTMEALVSVASLASSPRIVSKWDSGKYSILLGLETNGSVLGAVGDGANNLIAYKTNSSLIAINEQPKYLVAVWRGGNNWDFYLNGVKSAGVTQVYTSSISSIQNSTANFQLGRDDTGSQLNGSLIFVRVRNVDLTDSEVAALAQNPWQIFSPVSSTYLSLGAAPAPTIYEFQSFSRGVGRGIARGIA